jgi:TetR/AcrR family transcriptional regulator
MNKDMPHEVQREVILDAAAACFSQLGYDGSSLSAIAAQCGLPESVVGQHFASKDDIRKALYVLWSERLSAWMVNG